MNDPATTTRNRFGLYFFFLGHMTVFGTGTFYMAYHVQYGDLYGFVIPIIVYAFHRTHVHYVMFGRELTQSHYKAELTEKVKKEWRNINKKLKR